jgi:hypothetical protein
VDELDSERIASFVAQQIEHAPDRFGIRA